MQKIAGRRLPVNSRREKNLTGVHQGGPGAFIRPLIACSLREFEFLFIAGTARSASLNIYGYFVNRKRGM
jgi:hypothetical protein